MYNDDICKQLIKDLEKINIENIDRESNINAKLNIIDLNNCTLALKDAVIFLISRYQQLDAEVYNKD